LPALQRAAFADPTQLGNVLRPEFGTFADYFLANANLAIHIPPQMSFEDAATLPSGLITIALGFYRYLELPMLSLPLENIAEVNKSILIYGGSSATGTLAIQFAKL